MPGKKKKRFHRKPKLEMEWWSVCSLSLSSFRAIISYLTRGLTSALIFPYNEKNLTCETSLCMISGLSSRAKIMKTYPTWVGQHEKKQSDFFYFVKVLREWLSISQWSQDQKTNPSTMVQLASEFNPKARNEAKQYGEKKEEVSG